MKIKDLLDSPNKWTKGAFARARDGRALDNPRNPKAVCWCFSGALDKCYPGERNSEARAGVRAKLSKAIGRRFLGIINFNDNPHTTFADIRRVLEKADV